MCRSKFIWVVIMIYAFSLLIFFRPSLLVCWYDFNYLIILFTFRRPLWSFWYYYKVRFLFFWIWNNSNVFNIEKLIVFNKASIFRKMWVNTSMQVSIFKMNNLLNRELDLLLVTGLAIVYLLENNVNLLPNCCRTIITQRHLDSFCIN